MKPRELWCDIAGALDKGRTLCLEAHKEKPETWDKEFDPEYNIHVVEYSALSAWKEQAEKLAKELSDAKESLAWYENVFAGWETNAHEFEHFWRVELPSQMEQALAEFQEFKKKMGAE